MPFEEQHDPVVSSEKGSKLQSLIMSSDQAAGSVWNKNSWHWEEKDYGKWAKQRLVEVISNLNLVYQENAVSFKDVNPTGFATISVRKGKKIVSFEFEVSCAWECGNSSGRIAIPEFSQEDATPVLRVTLSSGDESCKEYIRKSTSVWHDALKEFTKDLKSAEGSEESLQLDRTRRNEELQKAVKAQEEKGEEKLRIAQQVKAAEPKPVTDAQASVWNVNAYHWETRRVEKQAQEWLKTSLEGIGLCDVIVTGEAEVSIRKGKKIVVFDLGIETAECRITGFTQEDDPKIQLKTGEDKSAMIIGILKGLEEHLRKTN